MDNFGKKLREKRETLGLELDQIARETNISSRYLKALENEDFSILPAEPYLLGFLRNYCEYLGLNSAEFISAYKNIKIQETPIPLKELMPKRRLTDSIVSSNPLVRRTIMIILLSVVVVVSVFAISYFVIKNKDEIVAPAVVITRSPSQYALNMRSPVLKERFYEEDTIEVTTELDSYEMKIISTAPSVKIESENSLWVVELGQDMSINLSDEDNLELAVFVADLFKNDPSQGAVVHLSLGEKEYGTMLGADGSEEADITISSEASTSKQQVLFEGGSAYPVVLNATFRGYCLFRYESDRTDRDERYYQKSEQLTVQAKNGLRIWASNGNAVKLQIVAGGKTVDLESSRPGEVIVKDLKWIIDDESGRYKFVVMDID